MRWGVARVVRRLLFYVAVILALPVPTIAASAEGGSVGRNVVVNRPGLIDANNSPSIARNPKTPDNLVAVHRVDRPTFSAAMSRSTDNGRTWHPVSIHPPAGRDRVYAPDAAFGPDGRLYVVFLTLAGRQNVPDNLWVAVSDDGGRTLGDAVRLAGRLSFQPRVAVSGKTVFVTWLQAVEVGPLRFAGGPNPVVVSTSHDGGRTFSLPVQVSDAARERVGAASPVVDSGGNLVVLYEDFKADRRDFENLEGPAWDKPFALVVTRSTDDGRSFSRGVELESGVVPTHRFIPFVPEYPSIAAGPGARLYVAWTDGRRGDDDVFLRSSNDSGRSWQTAVRVNNNQTRDGTTQYLPRIGVSKDGRVDVVFLDRRRDRRDVMTDAYLATSRDDGRSFSNSRISSRSFDSRVGPSAATQFGVDFGARLGIVSRDRDIAVVWTDSRFGTQDTGRQDVESAVIAVAHTGGVVRRWPLVLGAGLVAAAVFAVARRRNARRA